MMKSNNELLEQIKLDRIKSLKLVRESITSNQNPVLSNIATAVSLISKDETATNHLKAIIKAKEMIASLMTKAALATTDEEIIAVRKSLNYYLNKVKNEIQKRNMSKELYDNYYQSISYLREDISECLRVIKRQANLDRLTNMINSGVLTAEELKEVKKYLNNEKRFNKRLLEKYGASEGVKRKPKKASVKENESIISTKSNNQSPNSKEDQASLEKESSTRSNDNFGEVVILVPPHVEQKSQDFNFPVNIDKEGNEIGIIYLSESQDADSLSSSTWQSNIKNDYNRYRIERPYEYGDRVFKNFGVLCSNIGIYRRNKGRAKCMMDDYRKYSHSESLKRLINYTLYNNSIKGALDQIFRNTALGRYESEKAREHRLYIEEIYEAIDFKEENTDQKLVKSL